MTVEDEGYRLAYRVAGDILRGGVSVVADSCNPLEVTRRAWEQVAVEAGVTHVNIQVVCSDVDEHRRRVEQRTATVTNLRLPTWVEVEQREYEAWTSDRVVMDTAGKAVDASVRELLAALGKVSA